MILATSFSEVLKWRELLPRSWNILHINKRRLVTVERCAYYLKSTTGFQTSWGDWLVQNVLCLLKRYPRSWVITLNHKIVNCVLEILYTFLKRFKILIIFSKMQYWLPLMQWIYIQVFPIKLLWLHSKKHLIIDQTKGFQQKTLLKWTNLSCTITCLGLTTKYFSKISGRAMHEFTWIEMSKVF